MIFFTETANDCLLIGEQSFINLAFELSELWTNKGIQLLKNKSTVTEEDKMIIRDARSKMKKRKMMVSLNLKIK